MTPTYDQLVAYTREIAGQTLYTKQRRKPFEVSVNAGSIEVTPGSGMSRKLSRRSVEKVLQRFRETGSYSPARYTDVTFNASYVLALIQQRQASE